MALHPLHTPEFVCAQIQQTGEYFDEQRQTGRTTAAALALIAKCIRTPRNPLSIRDHAGIPAADVNMRSVVRIVVQKLQLKEFYIRDFEVVFGKPNIASWRLQLPVWSEPTADAVAYEVPAPALRTPGRPRIPATLDEAFNPEAWVEPDSYE